MSNPPTPTPTPEPNDIPPLSPELLLHAYRQAIFPMADPDPPGTGEIDWYSPDPRAILPLDSFHIPRNLARLVRQKPFRITSDECFERVMRECARPRGADNPTWISEDLIRAYTGLFDIGHAHSLEAWLDDELVGGLYGVHIGAAFFGESMFSRPKPAESPGRPGSGGTNSSKVCLVHLVDWLKTRGFTLLDIQFTNPHLEQFGCVEIPREEYLFILEVAVKQSVAWGEFISR